MVEVGPKGLEGVHCSSAPGGELMSAAPGRGRARAVPLAQVPASIFASFSWEQVPSPSPGLTGGQGPSEPGKSLGFPV